MDLESLIKGLKIKEFRLDRPEIEITDVTFDSRNATAGSLFIAINGEQADGHSYLKSLEDKNIGGIVIEYMPEECDALKFNNVILVENSRKALALIAANFYGNPSKEMNIVGVTGTNGKTTIATLIYEMCRKEGVKAGLLSTVANYIDGVKYKSTHTTPDPVSLNRMLREMADAHCKVVAMEVSSHAAHQHRIDGIEFKGAIFTNLTRDHLDYHGTLANYRDAKKIFFDNLKSDSFALINIDDINGRFMTQNTLAKVFTYSLLKNADFECRVIEKHLDSTEIRINGHNLVVQFAGLYNSYNLCAVYASLILLGFNEEETLIDLSTLKPVNGRFQTFRSSSGVIAIVDYAHTPDALENILKSLNDLKQRDTRIITVVGAGGNRDKGKRPIMGSIATNNSDIVIFTSDNPRFEEPDEIIADMVEGVEGEAVKKTIINIDRRDAIKTAFMLAKSGDMILVAGKGHEDYQEIKGIKHHFSDSEEIINIIG